MPEKLSDLGLKLCDIAPRHVAAVVFV